MKLSVVFMVLATVVCAMVQKSDAMPGWPISGLSDMKMPGLPEIKMPGLPEMKIPGLPEMKLPGLPEMKLPGLPEMKLPGLPGIKFPELKFPEIKLPEMNLMSTLKAIQNIPGMPRFSILHLMGLPDLQDLIKVYNMLQKIPGMPDLESLLLMPERVLDTFNIPKQMRIILDRLRTKVPDMTGTTAIPDQVTQAPTTTVNVPPSA